MKLKVRLTCLYFPKKSRNYALEQVRMRRLLKEISHTSFTKFWIISGSYLPAIKSSKHITHSPESWDKISTKLDNNEPYITHG